MADIQSTAAEIRRGKKDRRKKEGRKKLQGKNIMAPLLHRAAIKSDVAQQKRSDHEVRGVIPTGGRESTM